MPGRPPVKFHDFIDTYYEELQNMTMARMTHDILGYRGEFLIIRWKPKHQESEPEPAQISTCLVANVTPTTITLVCSKKLELNIIFLTW